MAEYGTDEQGFPCVKPTMLTKIHHDVENLRSRFQSISGGLQDLGTKPRAESVASAASNLADACDDLAKAVAALIEEVRR